MHLAPKVVHDVVKSISNAEATAIFEQLENRFRGHLNLLEEALTTVSCKCCNVNIMKTPYEVKKHIITDEHKERAGIANKKYKFFCEICGSLYSREASWQEHMHLQSHKSK